MPTSQPFCGCFPLYPFLRFQLILKTINQKYYVFFPQTLQNIIDYHFILKNLWNYAADSDTHTIETHIHRLRKKILKKFNDNHFIKNNNEGYYI